MNHHSEDDPNRLFTGFDRPTTNYFRMPDGWIDISAEIKNIAELKVVEYILRHTWGYREYEIKKHITVDEFIWGRKRRDGSRMDKGTGLSEQSVRNGLDAAKRRGLVEEFVDDADRARVKKYYGLKMRASSETDRADVPDAKADTAEQGLGPGAQSLDPGVQTFDRSGLNVRPRTETNTQRETFESTERSMMESEASVPANTDGPTEQLDDPDHDAPVRLDHRVSRPPNSRPGPKRSAVPPQIDVAVTELSEQFHDDAHRRSNVAQAMNLYIAAALPVGAYVGRLYEAGSITRDERNRRRTMTGGRPVENSMAYYFSVLRDLLGLKQPPAPLTTQTPRLSHP